MLKAREIFINSFWFIMSEFAVFNDLKQINVDKFLKFLF